ncbi:MAG: CotH kinase family protein [Bacteroidota bacterium]|nr:CotH kinase family protein [Bacteroidota bacterium]
MRSKNYLPKFKLLILCLGIAVSANAQVVINEYSCSNLTQFPDNYQDYSDWFELYNAGATSVNLGGYYLSDDSLNNTKWQIPATVNISGQGFLRFWADGRDEVSGPNLHTGFKLTQTKNNPEFIILSNPSGVIVDYIKFSQKTQLGHSIGRTFNGLPTWSIFTSPTPNTSNNSASPYFDYADRPDYSLGAGFYPGAITIAITTNEPNADIHYTTDGSLPTVASPIYTTPINIATTSVVKAITISTDPEILPSFLEFETYFINVSHTMPVISIAASQLSTLANGSGNLEPKGSFELFDVAGVRVAKTYGEFNRHGQDSWVLSQRSLDFISRDEMGYNHSVEEQLFASTTRDNFQKIILRAAGDDNYPADGNNANEGSAHIRDAYIHNMAIEGGLNLDVRRGSKAIVYLNGAYWGVYDIRDNPDDHDFTGFYYGQDKYNLQYIETWGNTWAEYGGQAALNAWASFYSTAMGGNMNDPAHYQWVMDRYDATSLVDYVIVNSVTVCSDWLNYNTGWWRGMDSTGTHLKWGYILWDNDATFGHYINYTGIPNTNYNADPCNVEQGLSDPKGHIDFLNKLRTNPEFNQYYINRQIDLWNTVFSCDNMLSQLDSIIALLDPEMQMHVTRWSGTYSEWVTNTQQLRDFILQRCNYMSTGLVNCYQLTGPYDLTINTDPAGAGTVQLNSLNLTQFPWTGSYFGNINTNLTVTANPNYAFTNWSANSQVFNPNPTVVDVDFTLTSTDSIVAHFISSSILPEIPFTDPSVGVYPSVFSANTTIEFYLPEYSKVSMKLYSLLGGEVMAIDQGTNMQPGKYEMNLDLSGSSLPAGIYLLDFNAGKYKKSVKIIYTPE